MPSEPSSSPGPRKAVLAAVIGAFVLMQVVLVFAVRYDTLDMDVGPNTQPSPDFSGTISIGQTFVAAGANIARIDLMFGTHDRKPSYRIGFELFDAGRPDTPLAVSGIEAAAVRNNLFNEFRFPTVRGTRGRTFLLRLLAPAAVSADAVALWTNPADIHPGGTMMYNGAPAPGDLMFRVYSRRTIISELGRLVQKNPGPLGSPLLFIIVILLLEASLIWTLWSIVDRIFARRGPHV